MRELENKKKEESTYEIIIYRLLFNKIYPRQTTLESNRKPISAIIFGGEGLQDG